MTLLWNAETDYLAALEKAHQPVYKDVLKGLFKVWWSIPRNQDRVLRVLTNAITRAQQTHTDDPLRAGIPHIEEHDVPPSAASQGKAVIERVGVFDLTKGHMIKDHSCLLYTSPSPRD